MDQEAYIIYGMTFGFLALWLLFSLAKKLGNSSRFPKQKVDQKIKKYISLMAKKVKTYNSGYEIIVPPHLYNNVIDIHL